MVYDCLYGFTFGVTHKIVNFALGAVLSVAPVSTLRIFVEFCLVDFFAGFVQKVMLCLAIQAISFEIYLVAALDCFFLAVFVCVIEHEELENVTYLTLVIFVTL